MDQGQSLNILNQRMTLSAYALVLSFVAPFLAITTKGPAPFCALASFTLVPIGMLTAFGAIFFAVLGFFLNNRSKAALAALGISIVSIVVIVVMTDMHFSL